MKAIRLLVVVGLLGLTHSAFAAKPCEELKSEIEATFKTKGVQNYTLDIVTNGAEDTGKTIGTCDGGTKHLSYKRGGSAAPAKAEMNAEVKAAPASAVAAVKAEVKAASAVAPK
ncbi:MAG: DUF1161 domain-containing protein [Sideroxydans sp.]|nr:DUF1161 domain-containing protein [Sideroxydans sp.]